MTANELYTIVGSLVNNKKDEYIDRINHAETDEDACEIAKEAYHYANGLYDLASRIMSTIKRKETK